jgi:hypothetical protein
MTVTVSQRTCVSVLSRGLTLSVLWLTFVVAEYVLPSPVGDSTTKFAVFYLFMVFVSSVMVGYLLIQNHGEAPIISVPIVAFVAVTVEVRSLLWLSEKVGSFYNQEVFHGFKYIDPTIIFSFVWLLLMFLWVGVVTFVSSVGLVVGSRDDGEPVWGEARGGEAVSALVSIGGVVLSFLALGYAHGFDSSEGEYILIGSYCVIVVVALSLQTLLLVWEEKEA